MMEPNKIWSKLKETLKEHVKQGKQSLLPSRLNCVCVFFLRIGMIETLMPTSILKQCRIQVLCHHAMLWGALSAKRMSESGGIRAPL